MASPFSTTTSPPASQTRDWSSDADAPMGADRSLGRRPGLPGGRALIGAALVVAAGVLTFAAFVTATASAKQSYVVTKRQLQPNEQVTAADVQVVSGELPPEVASQTFSSADAVVGAVVLAPLAPNALMLRSVVLAGDAPGAVPEAFEVSFKTPRWKLGDRVRAGEVIDIVPIPDRNDPSSIPPAPVRNVRVIAREDPGRGGLGSGSEDVILTVAAENQADYVAVVNAVRGDFYPVRSTRAAPGSAQGPTVTLPAPSTFPQAGSTTRRP